jgi:hypothetical protein
VKFKDLYNKTLLQEGPVPFSKFEHIKNKIAEQYSIPDGTFGVEYEYIPPKEIIEIEKERIIKALNNAFSSNNQLDNDYSEWLEEKRENTARAWVRYGRGDVSRYDDSYGPMSEDTFTDVVSEPKIGDFNEEEEYEAALKEYNDKLSDINYDYQYWERRNSGDYTDEFFEYIANNNWEDYVEVNASVESIAASIKRAINDLSGSIGIMTSDRYNPARWTVGQDGDNIEIRSPILRKNEMDQVNIVSNYVDGQELDGGTGLHVHIGVPKDFDAFDLLAMTTLVDEDQVQKELDSSSITRDSSFAKFRESLAQSLIYIISKGAVSETFVLSNNELLTIFGGADRYSGTNIKAFAKYKTVEFRYFGAHNSRNLPKWIEYFLLLPNIAQKRNRVVLSSKKSGLKMYAIRMPGGKTQFQNILMGNKPTIKPTGYPAATLKTMKPPLTPKERGNIGQNNPNNPNK